MKRKILSISSSTSCLASSRKYSAMVSAACPTRKRAPGGSFIWPKTSTVLSRTPAARMSRYSSSASRQRSPMPQNSVTPLMAADHVVNQLRDQNGFADARSAEQPGFAAAFQRRKQVDGLDAGLQDLRRHALLRKVAPAEGVATATARRRFLPDRRSSGRTRSASGPADARPREHGADGPCR